MLNSNIVVVTSDNNLVYEIKKRLAGIYTTIPRVYENIQDIYKFKKDLKDNLIEILGVQNGNIDFQHVIIDSTFKDKKGGTYFIDDELFIDMPNNANSALAMLLGAGISVIVKPNNTDFYQGWKVGNRGAQTLININEIKELIEKAKNNRKYDFHTLEVENEFARVYDAEELAGAATVSAILWENSFVLEQIQDYAIHSTQKIRILDLGCGTGRFEEILFKHKIISEKIEQIVAVDFAPQYLVEANKRLVNILGKSQLKKIKFLRRVAETLHFPENYFDIVIASFGVVCFSKSYLTLQQIYSVLKHKGLVLLNGYNREALTFDFDNKMKESTGQPASHFAIRIDREENIMYLGNSQIKCFTFDSKGMETLLKQIGFKPKKDSIKTFPTLYGASRKDYLKKLSQDFNVKAKKISGNSKRDRKIASYESTNLAKDIYDSGFNEILHLMDTDLALVMEGRGFYFCSAANK